MKYQEYLALLRGQLPLGECFDLLERKVMIGGREGMMYAVDGLTDSDNCQRVIDYLMRVTPETMEGITDSETFIAICLPFMDASLVAPKQKKTEGNGQNGLSAAEDCCNQAVARLYAGLVPLIVEGLDQIIVLDMRDYPARSVEEPEKEKTLRGAKDGFTEGFMQNIGLIRRRIRDNQLIFKNFTIGSVSKSDVAIAYMKGKADKGLVQKVTALLQELEQDETLETLTVGDQSLLERIQEACKCGGRLNPFPKVRYSQRPDIISAHITEGKIALIVDNSPTVMLIPVGIFDFLQDVDDYYFPQLTGNYFRLLRILNFIVILFLTPIYLLIIQYEELTPETLRFFIPDENFAIPIFWQFILLEIAIDGLKLASLNTPESLGMSLSVIGALILGEFSIDSGWFIPQTILCMAVVALASFTQPSIELSYAVKFTRLLMLIGAWTLGIVGIVGAAILSIVVMATTRTMSGDAYLYPLAPFKWAALKKLLFRTSR